MDTTQTPTTTKPAPKLSARHALLAQVKGLYHSKVYAAVRAHAQAAADNAAAAGEDVEQAIRWAVAAKLRPLVRKHAALPFGLVEQGEVRS